MTRLTDLEIRRVDYALQKDATALVFLLDAYAQDAMGGGVGLDSWVKAHLCSQLSRYPHACSFIAWQGEQAIGLVNCFETLSTFKARPLLNIHDIAVLPACRGQGVGMALMQAVETEAIQRGCCKLTLEVLSGNATASKLYTRFGFAPYALDEANGQAMFMQKWLLPSA